MVSESTSQFKREPAVRIFVQELSQVVLENREEQDRFATSYSFSITGAKIFRVFICGVLTEVDEMEVDGAYFIKARVVDPTGSINIMAGQNQPEVMNALRKLKGNIPAYVAVVGKPNIYMPTYGGNYVSIRPESLAEVTEQIRDAWIAETAQRTIERIKALKEIMQNGKANDEMRKVLSVYSPNIDDLKHMIKVAVGTTLPDE